MPDPEFFQEIKDQYSRSIESRNNLDSKANNIITMSGTIVTLLMGFGTFILKDIKLEYAFLHHAIFALAIGIVLMIIGIVFSVLAYRVKTKLYPVGYKVFYPDGKYNKTIVDKFRNSTEKEFYARIIEEYLASIKSNMELNSKKSKMVKISQWLFLAGISTVPILSAFLINAMLTSNIIISKGG